METYSEWLRRQTPERQEASLEHMAVCQKYGEAQRAAPFSEETMRLRDEIAAYNRKYGE